MKDNIVYIGVKDSAYELAIDYDNNEIKIEHYFHEWMLGDDSDAIMNRLEKADLTGAIEQARHTAELRDRYAAPERAADLRKFADWVHKVAIKIQKKVEIAQLKNLAAKHGYRLVKVY